MTRDNPRRSQLALRPALAALSLIACSSGYDVSLSVSKEVSDSCSTSCVRSVLMYAIGTADFVPQCVRNVSMPSLQAHGLDGKFDLPVPGDLAGVWVAGYRGADCDDVPVFDGIASVSGDSVSVPVQCLASCSEQGAMTIKTTDLFAAMQGRCETGPGNSAAAGVLMSDRWGRFTPIETESVLFGAAPAALLGGTATFPDAPKSVGRAQACPAVAVFNNNAPLSMACVRRYKGLCLGAADEGKIEVATLSIPVLQGTTGGEVRSLALFAERDAATQLPKPLAGATVAIELLSAPARIVYHDLTIQGGTPVLTDRMAPPTGPSGAFSVYAREPVTIAITHNGRTYRRQIGGGLLPFIEGPPVVGAQIITPE